MSEAMKSSAIYALRRFNEKAEKLASSNFLKEITSEPFKYELHLEVAPKVSTSWRTGPEGESIEFFVNTVRQFYQGNDQISFGNMAQHYEKLFAAGLIPENLASEFRKVRDALNQYLDSETFMTLDEPLTHRLLFEVFVYGYLSHNNPKKRAVYDQWKADYLFPFIEGEFLATMVQFLNAILLARHLNERTLDEITAP
jgi:hypothetical protein